MASQTMWLLPVGFLLPFVFPWMASAPGWLPPRDGFRPSVVYARVASAPAWLLFGSYSNISVFSNSGESITHAL